MISVVRKCTALRISCCLIVNCCNQHVDLKYDRSTPAFEAPHTHACPVIHCTVLAAFVRAQGDTQPVAGQAFVPEVLYEGNYYPICGHFFWDNDEGAKTVCNALGFASGTVQRIQTTYTVDAMWVGKCNAGEPLDKCTAGANAWGNFNYVFNDLVCTKGSPVGLTVTCTGEYTVHHDCPRMVGMSVYPFTHHLARNHPPISSHHL